MENTENTKEITVEIPAYLYEASRRMTALGLFRDLSDVVSAGLRRELREAQQVLQFSPESWQAGVEKLRAQIQHHRAEMGQAPLSEEEVITQLRAIRKEIWERDYSSLYALDAG